MSDIHDDHNLLEALSAKQITLHQLRPVILISFRRFGVTVTGQIYQFSLLIIVNGEEIYRLGSAGCFRGFSKLFVITQSIDDAWLSRVRTTAHGYLNSFIKRELRKVADNAFKR